MKEFTGCVAVVTGGASGIGAAVAALLAERDAVVAVLDRDIGSVDPDRFVAIRCDISSTAEVDAAVSEVVARCGGLDVVVNNAGVGAVGDITAQSDAEWHRVFDVNVVGIVRVTRAALPALRRSTRAAVVSIGSKCGGSHARMVRVPPRFGVWARAGRAIAPAARPRPAAPRSSRRVRRRGWP